MNPVLGGIAQNQDKGLSWDFPVILVEFSPDSVAWKQAKLSEIMLLWRFIQANNQTKLSSSNSDQ